MEFFRCNPNPKGWKTGDCVIRSISFAMNAAYGKESWSSVYKSLCEIGQKKCRLPNEERVYTDYLKTNNFVQQKQMKHPDGTRYTVQEVIEAHPNDIILIHCARHLTCGIRGNLYDSWNCGYKTAGKFYKLASMQLNEEVINKFEESMLQYLES